ncbi:MAG: hypothetical protein ABSF18_07740 [Gammaproteobacteria bacterium]|jgi:hypothetical protein
MAASNAQVSFFNNLLDQKQFPEESDKVALLAKFETLSVADASKWIEKALTLPDVGESNDPIPY